MSATVPIPANLWQKLSQFLADGASGQVILDVKDGQVEACRLTEFVRAERSPAALVDKRC
jgi:hypothetical protein